MLSNKRRIVVTGGSSGIGLAIVERFISNGDDVFNLDIQEEHTAHFIHCDVTDHNKVRQSINAITANGPIDVLICNAGAHLSANIEETDEHTLQSLFNLNVKGAFSATQASLPAMKKAGGSIIYIASDQAQVAKANSFAYNLTKHALASMAKTTAIDYADYNIRANALCPGTIDTPLYHNAINKYCARTGANKQEIHAEEASAQPLGRIGTSEEVAGFAYFLSTPDASFITGTLQLMDGGYCAR